MDAIVLAGGGARRMGGADKPGQLVGGRSMLARVVDGARAAGAQRVVVVGPRRDEPAEVVWTLEHPRGGGPVAAIAAGLRCVSSDVVLVLAADLPEIGAGLPALLDAVRSADCAVMVDAGGRRNPLATAWQRASLRRALDAIGVAEGARASALLDSVRVVEVVDAGGWGTDCDTWDDLARARAATTEQETP